MFSKLFFNSEHVVDRLLGLIMNITFNEINNNYHNNFFKMNSYD
jgi:hypothetical protein